MKTMSQPPAWSEFEDAQTQFTLCFPAHKLYVFFNWTAPLLSGLPEKNSAKPRSSAGSESVSFYLLAIRRLERRTLKIVTTSRTLNQQRGMLERLPGISCLNFLSFSLFFFTEHLQFYLDSGTWGSQNRNLFVLLSPGWQSVSDPAWHRAGASPRYAILNVVLCFFFLQVLDQLRSTL